ncbi:MAG: YggS family pyridoxal phosphate-dependent enzyme [Bacteroidales bacterium]|nr:YggS family pyridoxal phosphate-dependent enzyme [Bacteroidales bacterium]
MIESNLKNLWKELPPDVKLVAVSKYYPVEAIQRAYDAGQKVFAESRPQDFAAKVQVLPKDIEWHFIGHLQTNKLKLVLPYAALVQSVDTRHLLDEIEKWGKANERVTDILLEIHIGAEQTKQGFAEEEALEILFNADKFPHVRFRGLMAMATNTEDESIIDADFERIDTFMAYLKDLFPELEAFDQLSIGMSGDYKIALRHGATMVRIGTAIFAE